MTLLEKKNGNITELHPDLALLLPTSGSTGSPKVVRISRNNLLANTKSICQYMNLSEEDRAITSLPMSYTYGLSVINTHLYVGASIFLTKIKVIQRRFWDYMRIYRITFLAGVPYTFETMKKIKANTFELPALRILTQAGGKLSGELQEYWGIYAKQTGKEFYVMYGQTEATARISYLPPEDCLRKIGSVGIPIPDSEIEIIDKENKRVDVPKKIGQVVCIGEHVSMGYAEKVEDLARGDENRKILYTGDFGYLDKEGYLVIKGRNKRFAKLLGKRIDLNYLEREAENIFGISVIALSNDYKIFLYTDADVPEDMIQELMRMVGVRVNVFEVRKREHVPRNFSGKIDYRGENLK